MVNKAGQYRKNLSGEAVYNSYVPALLRSDGLVSMDKDLWQQLMQTRVDPATLEAFSNGIPDIEMFVAMYVRKEALMSSQIEGTQATLEDVLDPLVEDNANLDVSDVINYVAALQCALQAVYALPLCMRLLCEGHAVLLQGVRGQERFPDEIRRSQKSPSRGQSRRAWIETSVPGGSMKGE